MASQGVERWEGELGGEAVGFAEAKGDGADLDALRGDWEREGQRAELGAGAEDARAVRRAEGAGRAGGVVLEDDEREAGGDGEGGDEFEGEHGSELDGTLV